MEPFLAQEILLSAQKVADEAEVFCISSRGTPVYFEANRLKQIQTKESATVVLRIFREGKIGLATATGITDVATLLDMAVETSKFGPPANFQFPRSQGYPEVAIFDPEVQEIKIERMIELGNELIAKVRDYAPDINCDVGLAKSTQSVHIINSQGGEASYGKSFWGLSLEGILIQDTDMLFVGDEESSCCSLLSIDGLAARVIRQLELAKGKAAVSTKSLPVIFTPQGVAGAFLSPIALAFSGKTVLEGASALKGKLGERVFNKGLNLWDDATIAHSTGSCPCDDEGTPSQCLPLIVDGVVSNFLYDLQTAALAGTRSTGNGKRADGSSPRPGVSSLVIDRGDVSFEEMVKDIEEGLVVEQVIGAEQGNLLAGDFGGNVLLGYKVEKGEIVGRVKDAMISGNVYQVLKELLGIGSETRWVYGILQTPPLYCSRISVTASPKPSPPGEKR